MDTSVEPLDLDAWEEQATKLLAHFQSNEHTHKNIPLFSALISVQLERLLTVIAELRRTTGT